MGLDGFLSFVKKKCPQVIYNDDISLFAHSTVFFDISSYIYRYICIYGNQSSKWINAIFHLFLTFRKNKINIIPVFDGKPPDEKKDEIDDRKEKRNKIKNKSKSLEDIVNQVRDKDYDTIDQESIDLFFKTLQSIQERSESKLKNLLKFSTISLEEKGNDIRKVSETELLDVENYIFKLKSQMVYIGQTEHQKLKDLLNILGVPFAQAPEEAETYCCYQIKQGLGKAIISCDTDCFTHGADIVILKLESTGEVMYVKTEELLRELEMTQSQFIDFSFLIGCDYNKKNKLPKVGPVKALELIKKYEKLENMLDIGYDNEKINSYIEMRKLFLPSYKKIKSIVTQDVDMDALETFILEHNLTIRMDKVEKLIEESKEKPQLVFSDD